MPNISAPASTSVSIVTDEQENKIKSIVDERVKAALAKAANPHDPRDGANYKRWMEGIGSEGSPFGTKLEGNDKAANDSPRMDTRGMIKGFLGSSVVKDFHQRREQKSLSYAIPEEKYWNPAVDRAAGVSGVSTMRTQLATEYAPEIHLTPNRQVRYRDIVPVSGITVGTAKYLKEAASTNSTTMMPENIDPASVTSASQSVAGVTVGSADVKTLTTYIPFPEQLMDDVPELESFLMGRLEANLLDTEDAQIASGDGTGNNMEGFYVDTGVQSILWSTGDTGDTMADAVLNGIIAAWIANYEPDLTTLYPSDFGRIIKDKDSQGRYQIPQVHQNYAPNQLWGKPVIVSTANPIGKAMTGAFKRYSVIRDRMAPTFYLAREHGTFKAANMLFLFINARMVCYRYRSDAFCKVTFDTAP